MTDLIQELIQGTGETLYMTFVAALFILVIGIPLGVLLTTSDAGGIWPKPMINRVLGWIVNVGRSAPFIILLVAVVPLTRAIVGTTIGTSAAIVPLVIAAIPFMGRVVEQSLREVDAGLIEAAAAMGSSRFQIVFKVMLPEAMPSLIRGVSLMLINLIGLSAMAGAIGGGGLGDLAIKYGYMRFQTDVMLGCLVVLVLLVQVIQWIGDLLAAAFTHK
ncbi:MAG: methionine ABC transporter permease [Mycobacterium leprae]